MARLLYNDEKENSPHSLTMTTSRRRKPRKAKKKRVEEAKWLTHYCSDHRILLIGEGDFSFSLSLAKAFASASNIVASSLDTYGDVIKKYKNAKSNLDELQKLGACLLHGVDATKMKCHSDLNRQRFDRVIYNFPHAGFHNKEDNLKMIKMHKRLVLGFFKSASCLLRANGEIHVNHKTNPPFSNWNIEKLAMQSSLLLIECNDFKKKDYPGYNNKRGDGSRCDEPFPLGKCSTFKFIYNHKQRRNRPFCEIHEQLPAPVVHLNHYSQSSLFLKMNEPVRPLNDLRNGYTPISSDPYNYVHDLKNGNIPISRDCFNNVTDKHGRVACSDHDLRSGNIPISRDYNNVTDIHGGRVVSSAAYSYYCGRDGTLDSRGLLQPMESMLSSQPRPTSTNCRYSLTEEPFRRTMDIAPYISLATRNEVFGGSSRYLQEQVCRTDQSSGSYYFDRARLDFEKYNADVPKRTLKSEIYLVH